MEKIMAELEFKRLTDYWVKEIYRLSNNPQIQEIQILTMEVEMQNTDTTIAEYCKELGIDTPF